MEWIKTSDQLPDEDIEVLVWNEIMQEHDIDYINDIRENFFKENYPYWTYLPERPNDE